ncbi:MAG: hypothetical protein IPP48_09525 [Chitinophagaceae bacterium]|nr:hypothetical protein [Chitinophagaceae bacterium]
MEQQHKDANAVVSYLQLRQLIGVLGISLPFVLILGTNVFGGCSKIQPSISHYYSVMHIVFTGTLCVLGGFLITYRGNSHYKYENMVSNFAGIFAFGVAMFPTSFSGFNSSDAACQYIYLMPDNSLPKYVNNLHFIFAALLFTCFVIFCVKIFQDADEGVMDAKKKRRNKIYKGCGIAILLSILSIAAITIYEKVSGKTVFPYYVFVFETTSLLPFGFSWLLKGSVNWKNSKSAMVRKVVGVVR